MIPALLCLSTIQARPAFCLFADRIRFTLHSARRQTPWSWCMPKAARQKLILPAIWRAPPWEPEEFPSIPNAAASNYFPAVFRSAPSSPPCLQSRRNPYGHGRAERLSMNRPLPQNPLGIVSLTSVSPISRSVPHRLIFLRISACIFLLPHLCTDWASMKRASSIIGTRISIFTIH